MVLIGGSDLVVAENVADSLSAVSRVPGDRVGYPRTDSQQLRKAGGDRDDRLSGDCHRGHLPAGAASCSCIALTGDQIVKIRKRDPVLPKPRLNLVVTAAGLVSLAVYVIVQVLAPPRPCPIRTRCLRQRESWRRLLC